MISVASTRTALLFIRQFRSVSWKHSATGLLSLPSPCSHCHPSPVTAAEPKELQAGGLAGAEPATPAPPASPLLLPGAPRPQLPKSGGSGNPRTGTYRPQRKQRGREPPPPHLPGSLKPRAAAALSPRLPGTGTLSAGPPRPAWRPPAAPSRLLLHPAAMAERRRSVSAATAAASPGPCGRAASPGPCVAAGLAAALGSRERGAAGAARARRAAAAGPSPWESEGPTAAAALLAECLAEGFVTQVRGPVIGSKPPASVRRKGGVLPRGFCPCGALKQLWGFTSWCFICYGSGCVAWNNGCGESAEARCRADIESLPGAFWLLTDLLVALLSQETLDSACQNITCFAKFAEREKIAKIRAEINEVQPLLLSAYS